jgi:hypothetical protein
MKTVDAIRLYQDFLAHRMDAPTEVITGAVLQAQEGCPEGYVCILENYLGRLRVQTTKK